jgi:hypothetical protein
MAVVFDLDLTAAEKISHRRDGFLGVRGARADRKDQVTKRKFRAWLEDLAVLFHNLALIDSNSGATVQYEQDTEGGGRDIPQLSTTTLPSIWTVVF